MPRINSTAVVTNPPPTIATTDSTAVALLTEYTDYSSVEAKSTVDRLAALGVSDQELAKLLNALSIQTGGRSGSNGNTLYAIVRQNRAVCVVTSWVQCWIATESAKGFNKVGASSPEALIERVAHAKWILHPHCLATAGNPFSFSEAPALTGKPPLLIDTLSRVFSSCVPPSSTSFLAYLASSEIEDSHPPTD
jgi:hypothetical protein